jgi:hypothetical protein
MNEQMEDTMKRGNNYSKILTACFGVLFTLAASVAIDAQGRYANRYSQRQVSDIIATLEQTSNAFRLDFDRNLDQSNLNGTREEDRLNGIVASYETSLNRLRRQFDRNNNWWASRDDVQNVMNNAVQVNQMMIALPFARRLERQWANMRRDLNRLAETCQDSRAAAGTAESADRAVPLAAVVLAMLRVGRSVHFTAEIRKRAEPFSSSLIETDR